jgi:hypothetical protein
MAAMPRRATLPAVLLTLLLGAAPALAQSTEDEEPTPPSERGKPKTGKPGTRGAVPAPAVVVPAHLSEPRPPEEQARLRGVSPPKPRGTQYGIAVQARAIFVPEWFQNAVLAASNSLTSGALAVSFIRRKGDFDLMANVDFGFYSPPDGTYLGKGKLPAVDANYIQFRNLNVLGFSVDFVWHHEILRWLSLIYGGGAGIGIVLGDIYRIHAYQGNCNATNLKDYTQCNPVDPSDATGRALWNQNHNTWLASHTGTGKDTAAAPHLYREDGVWPVVPILHLFGGVDFRVNDQFGVQLHGGFHTVAFYVGATGMYFF